tara:strand:+ start:54 stop:341 length:288 start_codon:yes stop_codon:yes gene_type:complete
MEEINKRLKNIELWIDNMSDKNRETYSLLIKADIEAIKEQLLIHSVGSSLPKVCKGCGSLSTKVIDKKYLACCPDSNYIPMEDYCKNSIYPEKQF